MPERMIERCIRVERMPHMWCPGCGNGILMRDIVCAVEELGLDHDRVIFVSGIGCSSRASGYLNFNTIHTTHGRALAFATGIKMARPEMEVIVITGDGDCSAIGGNHLIHAARRNIGITVIVFNNQIYGMTGGQYSPTTPFGQLATTSPYGNIDRDFDIASLAAAAGASFAARGDTYHTKETTEMIRRGILHKGFSIIDCISVCPTYYGRYNGRETAVEMLRSQRDHVRWIGEDGPSAEGEAPCLGVLTETDYPEYTEQYQKLIDRLQKEKTGNDNQTE